MGLWSLCEKSAKGWPWGLGENKNKYNKWCLLSITFDWAHRVKQYSHQSCTYWTYIIYHQRHVRRLAVVILRKNNMAHTRNNKYACKRLPSTRIETLWNFTFRPLTCEIKMPVFRVTSAESLRSYVDIFLRYLTLSFRTRAEPCILNLQLKSIKWSESVVNEPPHLPCSGFKNRFSMSA